nr:DUF6005 family protein [Cohnella mopanensis]
MLDCFASVIEEDDRLDFRPLYIGVWDAYFEANENGISYYSDSVDPMDWNSKFSMLYGNAVESWYDTAVGKRGNFSALTNRMRDGLTGKVSIIMVDVFYLPYSYQYRAKHAPHFVIVKQRQWLEWQVIDPYFDWNGSLSNGELWEAFGFDGFGRGLTIDTGAFRQADERAIIRLFESELHLSPGLLLAEVERFVHSSIEGNGGHAPKTLFASVQEAGVIAKRFGGCQYILQYLCERLGIEDNVTTSAITEMIKGWENLMLTLVRYQMQNKPVDLASFSVKTGHLRQLEISVRESLFQMFSKWRSQLPEAALGEVSNP